MGQRSSMKKLLFQKRQFRLLVSQTVTGAQWNIGAFPSNGEGGNKERGTRCIFVLQEKSFHFSLQSCALQNAPLPCLSEKKGSKSGISWGRICQEVCIRCATRIKLIEGTADWRWCHQVGKRVEKVKKKALHSKDITNKNPCLLHTSFNISS